MLTVQTWMKVLARIIVSVEQEFGLADDLSDDASHISVLFAAKGFCVDFVFFPSTNRDEVGIGVGVRFFKSVRDAESNAIQTRKIINDIAKKYNIKDLGKPESGEE